MVKRATIYLKPSSTGDQWVSFGLPLPPGRLTNPDQVLVKGPDGAVIPAFTKSLGNWRNVPPPELLAGGLNPTFPGIRSILIQFKYNFTTLNNVKITVDAGLTGQKLATGVPVRDTMKVVNDGKLYFGTEGVLEPKVYAAIHRKWMSCSGLNMLSGVTDKSPALAKTDTAVKNFFYTSVKDYRTSWDAPSGSWHVDSSYPHVDLYAPDDGTWLYQRGANFLNQYMRTGIFDMLREAHHAISHYSTLLYDAADCASSQWKDWCVGFFKIKNPSPGTSWKDGKYSYGEDLANYYWLTGDEEMKPLLSAVTAATKKFAAQSTMGTERNTAVALAAPVYEYEVTGDATLLPYIKSMVDFLYNLQNTPNSAGQITGLFPGNDEFGSEGFSPWMTPIMMQSLLRVYFTTKDARIPGMLAKAARGLVDRGMKWTSQIQNTNMLIPFYGGTNVGTPKDMDGDNPWGGIEHAPNVAQGVALGYLYETDPVKKQFLKDAVMALIISGEWCFNNWTRTTAGLPKYRLAPWRKYNWWFKNVGNLQWILFDKPTW